MNQVPQSCLSTNQVSHDIIQTYTIYECTKHAYQHVSPFVPRKYINHAPIPQQDESSYMYAKSTIKHVPINLLVGASTNVLGVYQSFINYDSSNMITSSTHQLYVPICSSSICQMHVSIYPTSNIPIIHHKIYQ
jgi:hypothetical protein